MPAQVREFCVRAAWRQALAPLTAGQRRLFADTLLAYEAAFTAELDRASTE